MAGEDTPEKSGNVHDEDGNLLYEEPSANTSEITPNKLELGTTETTSKKGARENTPQNTKPASPTEKAVLALQLQLKNAQATLVKEQKQSREAAAAKLAQEQWTNFIRYCKLTDPELQILVKDIGITEIEELKEFGGDATAASQFTSAGLNVLKARRILNCASYVLYGGQISKTTTIEEINSVISQDNPHVITPTKSSTSNDDEKDPEQYLGKADIDTIDKFTNDPADFEDYWKTASARLGATRAGPFLSRPPDITKAWSVANNQTLYFILLTAFQETTVESHIARAKQTHGECGYNAAQAIISYYRSDAIKSDVQQRLRTKLGELYIEGNPAEFTVIGEYLNEWQMLYDRLSHSGETWTDEKKRDQLLAGIRLDATHPIQQTKINMQRESKLKFETVLIDIDRIARVSLTDGESSAVKSRRVTNNTGRNNSSDSLPWDKLNIPDFVLTSAKGANNPSQAVSIILRWRRLFTENKRQVTETEWDNRPNNYSKKKGGNDNYKGNKHGGKRNKPFTPNKDGDGKSSKKKKSRRAKSTTEDALTTRKTTVTETGTPKSTVVVSIKDTEIEAAIATEDEKEDDSSQENNDKSDNTADNTKKTKVKFTDDAKTRRLKAQADGSFESVTVTRRAASGDHHLIFDSGTECEIIGGNGWTLLSEIPGRFERISGLFDQDTEAHKLQYAMAVTVYDHPTHGPILLGVAQAPFDKNTQQQESVLNPNYIGKFVELDERSKGRGGTQTMTIDGMDIPILLDEVKLLPYFKVRTPTENEIETLETHWLVPPGATREDTISKKDKSSTTRRNPVLEQPNKSPLSERLANCPDETAKKTATATTEYYGEDIAAEIREIPRRQMQKRLHAIHGKRLPGRSDTDTVFCSIKSIRNIKCFQLFVHLVTQFIYIVLMRRESESHGAYQDYVREVGIPNHLHSDNAQTETGKKWTKTSRQNRTKQTQSTPRQQNQNFAERKVNDIKGRVSHTLFCSSAPLRFWCYCLEFVIACLNVTARRGLKWQTPTTLMMGHTVDISRHRFRFWEPVWYFDATVKFPEAKWKPARFIGFAEAVGDPFTYKIWTVDEDDDWTTGNELIRNIVIRRRSGEKPPTEPPGDNILDFESSRVKQPTRQKRSDLRSKVTRDRKAAKASTRKRKRKGEETTPGEPATKQSSQLIADGITLATADLTELTDDPAELSHLTTDWYRDPEDLMITGRNDDNDDDASVTSDLTDGDGTDDIYNEFDAPDERHDIIRIEKHQWKDGVLQFRVLHSTEETSWEQFRDLREDIPRDLAQYMVDHNVSRSKRDPKLQWAKQTIRTLDRACRRIARLYHFGIDDNDKVCRIRRAITGSTKKKKKKNIDYAKKKFHYGVEIPNSVRRALEIDKENGNTLWTDALKLEVDTLLDYECFEFKPAGTKAPAGYQSTRLHVVMDVKHDGRRKCRLVAGGHLVDVPLGTETYASQVKPVSVKLIGVIAHKMKLLQLCGDISNAYINAECSEKVYVAKAGPEFGDKEGMLVIIKKALYGLSASGADWHRHFSNSLRSYGFKPTRYDKDVWIRMAPTKDHYEYITTHVDDFKITSKTPQDIMDMILAEYKVKGAGPPDYYLGNDYKQYKGMYAVGSKRYIQEALRRVKETFGELPKKESIPLPSGCHPETDTTTILNDKDHRTYQMLIGMLNWAVNIGRFDIAHATSSMARFTACPRDGHMKLVLRIFGYLRKRPNRRILVDSRDPILTGGDFTWAEQIVRKLRDDYPDAAEEIDINLPEPLVDELRITTMVDSDHAHDKITRRSITGIIILVGRTPVFYMSKRQGAVATSTYSAEFAALRTATEETMALRYTLRSLGVKVTTASHVLGDNLGVIQNATIKESLLKKKHVAISYHQVREAAAAGAILPLKIHTSDNYSDQMTKSLPIRDFDRLTGGLFYG